MWDLCISNEYKQMNNTNTKIINKIAKPTVVSKYKCNMINKQTERQANINKETLKCRKHKQNNKEHKKSKSTTINKQQTNK
jgi:hypothetical protein